MNLKGKKVFAVEDCISLESVESLVGKILVLDVEVLANEYKEACYQLWRAEGGFGCNRSAVGRAVYGTALADGERTRWNRHHFIGILKDELIEEYKLNVFKMMLDNDHTLVNGEILKVLESYEDEETGNGYEIVEIKTDAEGKIRTAKNDKLYAPSEINKDGYITTWENIGVY